MVRRPTPSNLAASVSERPSDFRHSEKSAPVIGNCSSAIRRSVEPDRSSRPHFVSTGQATPMPSSTISIFAKVSASSISGAKCLLRAINPVRSSTYSRRSPPKRTRRVLPPAGRTFFTIEMSPIILFLFGILSTAATTPPDSLRSSSGLLSEPCLARCRQSGRRLRGESSQRSRALDVHVRRILVLKEHQELEAAEALDLWHQDSRTTSRNRAFFTLVQAPCL